MSCRQGEEAWMLWKAGMYGDVSLSDGIIEYAKTHEEIKGAFLTFQKDADQIYPAWINLVRGLSDFPEGRGPDLSRLEGEARLHRRVLSTGCDIRLAEEGCCGCLRGGARGLLRERQQSIFQARLQQ